MGGEEWSQSSLLLARRSHSISLISLVVIVTLSVCLIFVTSLATRRCTESSWVARVSVLLPSQTSLAYSKNGVGELDLCLFSEFWQACRIIRRKYPNRLKAFLVMGEVLMFQRRVLVSLTPKYFVPVTFSIAVLRRVYLLSLAHPFLQLNLRFSHWVGLNCILQSFSQSWSCCCCRWCWRWRYH